MDEEEEKIEKVVKRQTDETDSETPQKRKTKKKNKEEKTEKKKKKKKNHKEKQEKQIEVEIEQVFDFNVGHESDDEKTLAKAFKQKEKQQESSKVLNTENNFDFNNYHNNHDNNTSHTVRSVNNLLSEREVQARAKKNVNELKDIVRLEKWARESKDIFAFGSNGLLQLGTHGIDQKLNPFPVPFAKAKRIVYMHAEQTSTFAISADRRMYFWGASPLNPHQIITVGQSQESNSVPKAAITLTKNQIEQRYKERERDLEREKKYQDDEREATKLVKLVPEYENYAKRPEISAETRAMLPHEFTPNWTTFATEPVVWISCGVEHVCGVTSIGRVFTYGSGANGRLGHGHNKNLILPQFISFDGKKNQTLPSDQVISCYCGADFSVLLTKAGDVYSFGCGEHFQLGHGSDADRIFANKIIGLKGRTIVAVGVGSHHCVALESTGFLVSWGANSKGQCGVGHTEDVISPTPITTARESPRTKEWNLSMLRERVNAKELKKKEKIKKQQAKANLRAAKEQIQQKNQQNHLVNDDLEGVEIELTDDDCSSDDLDKWKDIRIRREQKYAKMGFQVPTRITKEEDTKEKIIEKKHEKRLKRLKKIDELRSKAENEKDAEKKVKAKMAYDAAIRKYEEEKQAKKEARRRAKEAIKKEKNYQETLPGSFDAPLKGFFNRKDMVRCPANFVIIKCGSLFSAAVTEDGELYMWGDNSDGQLGLGTTTNQKFPTLVSFLSNQIVIQVACGRKHTAVVTANGRLYTWGGNYEGQLGLGHRQPCWIPTEVTNLKGIKISSVSCGLDHTVCLEGEIKTHPTKAKKFLDRQEAAKQILQWKAQLKEKTLQAAQNLSKDNTNKGETSEREFLEQQNKKADIRPDNLVQRTVVVKQKKKAKSGKKKNAAGGFVAVGVITMAAVALDML